MPQRSFTRRLFTCCAAASLAVCVATAGLWVRTRFAGDYVEFVGLDTYCVAHTVPGRLQGRVSVNYGLVNFWGNRAGSPRVHFEHAVIPAPTDWLQLQLNFSGIDWRIGPFLFATSADPGMDGRTIRGFFFAFPLWPVCLLSAIPPARWLATRGSRRDRPATACAGCGYDLRATPDRCPECGRLATPIGRTP